MQPIQKKTTQSSPLYSFETDLEAEYKSISKFAIKTELSLTSEQTSFGLYKASVISIWNVGSTTKGTRSPESSTQRTYSYVHSKQAQFLWLQ